VKTMTTPSSAHRYYKVAFLFVFVVQIAYSHAFAHLENSYNNTIALLCYAFTKQRKENEGPTETVATAEQVVSSY